MYRPYDYLPMITPDMVASVQQVSEEVHVEYLAQQQTSMYDGVLRQPSLGFGERANLFWASMGLVYATLDTAFTRDYGALYRYDHLPCMNPLHIQADLGRVADMPPMKIFEDFHNQQAPELEDRALSKAMRQQWEESVGWRGSDEDEVHLVRTQVVASLMMFIVNNESRRVDQLRSRLNFPS